MNHRGCKMDGINMMRSIFLLLLGIFLLTGQKVMILMRSVDKSEIRKNCRSL